MLQAPNDPELNTTITPIVPTEQVKTNLITGVQVRVVNLELFEKVTVVVHLFSNGSMVDTKVLDISGPDYALWTNDDQTLIDIVLAKLGYTKA